MFFSYFLYFLQKPCYTFNEVIPLEKFLPNNRLRLFSPENRTEELFVHSTGYDDFADPSLTPVKHLRASTAYTLHMVLRGKGTVHLRDKIHHVSGECLFFIPAGEPMCYYPDEDDPWEYVWFNFTGTQAQEYGRRMGFSINSPIRTAASFTAIRQTMKRLLTSLEEDGGDPYFLALSAFYDILYLCSRQPRAKGAPSARRMIDLNFSSPEFTVELLCRDLHISHSHLCRIFKQTYGISAVKYLIERRLELAQRLLETTDLPVKAVAYSCGFSDEMHFMKSFKAFTGETAREYRLRSGRSL